MYYNLSVDQENYLQHQPETGMGYQIIEAQKAGTSVSQKYLVLNSEIVIDIDNRQNEFVRKVLSEGIYTVKALSNRITLTGIRVLKETEIRSTGAESKNASKGALENPKEKADGKEMFTRLSAFEDDRRIDKENKCLLPGSFTTTRVDYLKCKAQNDNPIERYALPNDEEIRWAFEITPKKDDILQRGIVQPANGKRGGGEEAYFDNGTSRGSLTSQHAY